MIEQTSDPDQQFGKSLKTFHASRECIDRLHRGGEIETPDGIEVYPNQPLVLKNQDNSALALVSKSGKKIKKIDEEVSFFNITGRNKGQKHLLNILRDEDIRCVVVTGPAGTGKTTIVGSYLLEQVLEKGNYEKMILSKPLEIVTKSRYFGTVPGDEDDKFAPFLKSYEMMFKDMVGENGEAYIEQAISKNIIDFLPLELMRGASLKECLCWYDEAQNLNYFETLTLGSRLDDTGGSKMILSGDLAQRDRNITRNNVGIHKLVTSPHFLNSSFTAHINLTQNERGKVSQLFYDVFDDEPQKGE